MKRVFPPMSDFCKDYGPTSNPDKELKKCIREVRPIERAVEKRENAEAKVICGYCLAVRSALTNDECHIPSLSAHTVFSFLREIYYNRFIGDYDKKASFFCVQK